ncbi:MAG TPA: lytic murein transglycosylase [Parvularculaceae bacterium]|nr:lytic murein transglycosylase [Parvularculaceae bacterium]
MRRLAVAILGVLAISGLSLGPANARAADFHAWLESFRAEAAAAGISKSVMDKAFLDLKADPHVIDLNDNQPEFTRAIWDYLDTAVSDKRVADGRQAFDQNKALLTKIGADYGVDPEVIVAIWGIESSYGALPGNYDAIQSLATLAWKGRRSAYGRAQLIGALKIIQNGYATREQLKGSWAGALGQTQFVPTTYLAYAVDADGDGHRDIWTNLGDIFASTANYLAASRYASGDPWGVEVTLPAGFDYSLADSDTYRALAEWSASGVAALAGELVEQFDPNLRARVLLPAGSKGPAFLVFQNFEAILHYNNSTAYALAVGLLAQRIKGAETPMVTAAWPRDDRPLTLDERKALQQALKDKGFDPGPVDGVIGAGTKRALRAWQKSRNLPPDGYASGAVLQALIS